MSTDTGALCVQTHSVIVADRGGGRKIAQLRTLSEVKWGRALSGISTAEVTISGQACRDQAAELAGIVPRRHELVIYRNSQRIWEGPITEIKFYADKTVIRASDVVEYLAGTALSKWWPGPDDGGTDLATTRIFDIISHELQAIYPRPDTIVEPDFWVVGWETLTPPANVLPHLDVRASSTLKIAEETLPFQMTVAEHLDALAQLGLRYVTVGRSLIIWDGASTALGETRALGEADLGERVVVYATSRDFTSIQHVVGQASSDPEDLEGVGSAEGIPASVDYFGPWTRIDTYQEADADDLLEDAVWAQARKLIAERRDMRFQIEVPSGGSIRLSETLTIDHLVPGVVVPVKGTVNRKPVTARFMLSGVEVTETRAGESVSVTLTTEAEAS